MIRQAVTASATAILGALVLAPPAAAASGQQVLLNSGAVRCELSADNYSFGGGPVAVCALTNGQPWGTAPFETSKWNQRLNLAVVLGTGQFYWDRGALPDPASAPVSVDGGAYKVNGWTVQPEGLRTRLTYDASGHGIFVTPADIRGF
ncbi:hypothetical protein [Mycolicibacterium holsaticum]|jgi:Ca-activated chloride channel family protein|uniref:hypothetical protein n=1 Tax=Mycolicibacterium holsaticum TaxID=152142 RepID=UPI001C7D7459|nr:hypothetical protein [Mycolicibacterium holsaticum]QZA11044.1 hypothetical protein K3U96_17530 [Mycolicibacterium holsaticum DSM 44478 = JCM 12374]UNC11461.1 hypothetical protein H5U41_09300 [Mycolicibacterium holsaticum DSM 44478 = JCM 12374]